LELHSLTGAPDAHARWAYLKALENAANAIAVLNGPPLTERRFLLQFPQRAQAVGRPGLAGGLVDLFMPEKPDAETWQMWLENWRTAFSAASQQPDCPPRLHPCRQLYYERAADALFSDHPEAAVWMLLRTWTLTLTSLPEDSSLLIAWENACLSCGLGGSEFNHRLASLDTYLDSVEETLDIWAQQNGA
jgi:hypothetical protein